MLPLGLRGGSHLTRIDDDDVGIVTGAIKPAGAEGSVVAVATGLRVFPLLLKAVMT